MDIVRKLNEVQDSLSDEQGEEIEVVNNLMLLLVGREPKQLPREFEIECFIDSDKLETLLREKLELDVKEISFDPFSVMFGRPKFVVTLN